MTPYVRRYICDDDMVLFKVLKSAVANMPDIDLGVDEEGKEIVLSCHMLARSVCKVFALQYVDGYFCGGYQHSWTETPSGNIIDVYPVAIIGGPLMMDGNNGMIAQQLYTPESTRRLSQGRFGKQSFRRSVARIASALQKELDGT